MEKERPRKGTIEKYIQKTTGKEWAEVFGDYW
jgi:hypothetical protein